MIDVLHVFNSTLNACFSGCCKTTSACCSSLVQFVSMKMTKMLGWYFFIQSQNSLSLCTDQQSNNHTIFKCFNKPNCLICECRYRSWILWIIFFVVLRVDQLFSLKARSHPLLMYMNFPSLFGGNVLCMVPPIKTTWRGKRVQLC
jgi:hypothetical protein